MQQEDHTMAKREIEDGGNIKGVAGVEAETLGRIGAVQKREGSATKIGTTGGTTCRLMKLCPYMLLIHLRSWHKVDRVSGHRSRT